MQSREKFEQWAANPVFVFVSRVGAALGATAMPVVAVLLWQASQWKAATDNDIAANSIALTQMRLDLASLELRIRQREINAFTSADAEALIGQLQRELDGINSSMADIRQDVRAMRSARSE